MNRKNKLYNIFKNLKFKEDFLIIHSDILSFYKFDFTLNSLFKIFKDTFGKNKTLIFPTFNLKKQKKWHLNRSVSESGSLSEFVRKKKKIVRSLNPIHSIVIYGPKKYQIPIDKSFSSFGPNSSWEWLCKNKNVRNISIGIGFVGGATFCHYAEEKSKVFYRKYKKINTLIYNSKDKLINKKFIFFARKKGFKNNWIRCERYLKTKKILIQHENKYNIPIFSMNTLLATNSILMKIDKDEKFLI
jgi:aminoglycoside N3'-acetyltransferase